MYRAFANAKHAGRLTNCGLAFDYVIADFQHSFLYVLLHKKASPQLVPLTFVKYMTQAGFYASKKLKQISTTKLTCP